jgi:hypothetical protein
MYRAAAVPAAKNQSRPCHCDVPGVTATVCRVIPALPCELASPGPRAFRVPAIAPCPVTQAGPGQSYAKRFERRQSVPGTAFKFGVLTVWRSEAVARSARPGEPARARLRLRPVSAARPFLLLPGPLTEARAAWLPCA